ncbi:MAG: hypothetical protein AB1814_10215 [Thermodesulfobacteriota bacterium]
MQARQAYGEQAQEQAAPRPAARGPRLGVYCGAGSSHSWLWLADTCEALGLGDLRFLEAGEVASGGLSGLDALAVSGGDTFAMAGALGPAGAAALRRFIAGGGLYLGFCAGAYLLLRSSKEPLNLFNLVEATIANLSRRLPQPLIMPEKFATPYGCDYVFHPVREALILRGQGGPLGEGEFSAPLYGGPAMQPAGPGVEVLATYQDFSQATRFLAPRELAAQTLLGRAAVLRGRLGAGVMYLFGPHCEHPRFAQANRRLAAILAEHTPSQALAPDGRGLAELGPAQARRLLSEVRRQVSNSRIVALALEDHPARWRMGGKVYEPAKLRVFLEALWSRTGALERARRLLVPAGAAELPALLAGVTESIRALRRELEEGQETTERAAGLFKDLRRAAALYLNMYFATAAAGALRPGRARRLH